METDTTTPTTTTTPPPRATDNAWWNIVNGKAVPSDWMQRNQVDGCIGDELSTTSVLEDRAIGCLLGVFIGDVLGTPFEGERRSFLLSMCKDNEPLPWKYFVPGPHMGLYFLPERYGMYTDDTNSTLALASSLVECGGLLPIHAAHQYGRFWRSNPIRGYPESAQEVMKAVLRGVDIQRVGTVAFPEGSFANGGNMRISPISLAFRNANEDQLREAVRMAILTSHVHPEAVDSTFVHAYAITLLLKLESPSSMEPVQLLQKLLVVTRNDQMKQKLELLIGFLNSPPKERPSENQILMELCKLSFQIKAVEAEACALWAFVSHWNEPEECLMSAVSYGGDTDTVCSMAGALCGALHGCKWIPKRWFNNCENGERGRDYVIGLARKLTELDQTEPLLQVTQQQKQEIEKESLKYCDNRWSVRKY